MDSKESQKTLLLLQSRLYNFQHGLAFMLFLAFKDQDARSVRQDEM